MKRNLWSLSFTLDFFLFKKGLKSIKTEELLSLSFWSSGMFLSFPDLLIWTGCRFNDFFSIFTSLDKLCWLVLCITRILEADEVLTWIREGFRETLVTRFVSRWALRNWNTAGWTKDSGLLDWAIILRIDEGDSMVNKSYSWRAGLRGGSNSSSWGETGSGWLDRSRVRPRCGNYLAVVVLAWLV